MSTPGAAGCRMWCNQEMKVIKRVIANNKQVRQDSCHRDFQLRPRSVRSHHRSVSRWKGTRLFITVSHDDEKIREEQ